MLTKSFLFAIGVMLLVEANSGGQDETQARRDTAKVLDRRKRPFNYNFRWTNAIVPYVIQDPKTTAYFKRFIAMYEDLTCLRWTLWDKDTTPKIVGNKRRILFVRTWGTCSGALGYVNGQSPVHCCTAHGDVGCTHEIGHALGFHHEQLHPNIAGWARRNVLDMDPSKRKAYDDNTAVGGGYANYTYDISSIMHYRPSWSGNKYGMVQMLFPELSITWEYYYHLRQIAYGYKCKTIRQCKGKDLDCENDGYETILHGKCQCRCVTGLDNDNLCKTPLKKVTQASWPKGRYALPKVETGCPHDGSFQTGRLLTTGADGNSKSSNSHVKGTMKGKQTDINFCTRDLEDDKFDLEDDEKFNWPVGTFCIFMKGNKCPFDFIKSSFEYTVDSSSASGHMPDGSYGKKTIEVKVCCQYRGFIEDENNFPTDKPFALIRYQRSCQSIRGMHSSHESITIASKDKIKVDEVTTKWLNRGGKSLDLPLCYYKPTDMNCGDAITLTKSNPEATIEMNVNGRPYMECTWIIKGEKETSGIVLNFEDINIEKDGKKCKDVLEIRHARIGQIGLKYCDEVDYSIRSITDKVLVRFTTVGNSNSSFKIKAKMTDFDDMCYDPVDKRGLNYAGPVNYTRLYEPCLPWIKMKHCYRYPGVMKDVYDNLDGNACRNRDNSFRPWCYTDEAGCKRNYCDVCGLEVPKDKSDYCDKLKGNGFCTANEALALKYCAKTCFDKASGIQRPLKKYPDITCGKPTPPSDGEVIGKVKSSYKLGDTATYKCKRSTSIVAASCLTSGQWTEIGSACYECPQGSLELNLKCFKDMKTKRNYKDAHALCHSVNGTLAAPYNDEENVFLYQKVIKGAHEFIWIGINDQEKEGRWVYPDGSDIVYSHWYKGQPDNYNNAEDCATITRYSGGWNDVPCYYPYNVVCMVDKPKPTECLDVLGKRCQGYLKESPGFCEEMSEFAQSNCRKTCGYCNAELKKCLVENSNPNVLTLLPKSTTSISARETVNYDCVRFTYPTKGDKQRVCLPSGKLSGVPLQCEECPLGFKMVNNACHGLLAARMLTFADASEECMKIDGFIAMPKSQEENDAIDSLRMGQRIWIGIQDDDGTLSWKDGSKVTWTNWNKGKKSGKGFSIMNLDKTWLNVTSGTSKMATVCTLPKSGGKVCFDRTVKGVNYAGNVSVTRSGHVCNVWAGSKNDKCNSNPFKKSFVRYNLDSNYCRNPDNSGAPWCYYNERCSWELCDVCNENVPHSAPNIVEMKCKPPSVPSDAVMHSRPRSSYKLGEVVTMRCNRNKFFVTTTCLTNGDWSRVGYACTECPIGYKPYKNTCYGFVKKQLDYDAAKKECATIGGHLPRPESIEENDFMKTVNEGKLTWFDARRYKPGELLKWSDGTTVTWLTGEAQKYDCGFINEKGVWRTTMCSWIAPQMYLICAVDKLDNVECKNYLGDECRAFLEDKPSMCSDHKDFARANCAKSCGVCGKTSECKFAPVDRYARASTKDSTIATGEVVHFRCRTGTFILKGSITRACMENGKLTGTDLECGECPAGYEKHNGYCYGFIDRNIQFHEAARECKKWDGYVASPKSKAENDLAFSIGKGNRMWLGATRSDDDQFRWQDGTNLHWSKWERGEPNNYGGREDCVELYYGKIWNDLSCWTKRKTVCVTKSIGDDVCYDTDTKGATYDGKKDVSRKGKCIPWAKATKCKYHPFNEGSERGNLVENYCRNPDNSPEPWCYTDAGTCDKYYCDVCENEKDKDYTTIKCPKPVVPSDGILLGTQNGEYKVGDEIKIACKNRKTSFYTSTCMDSGKWTPVGLACGACTEGDYLFKDTCYSHAAKSRTYFDAEKYCQNNLQGHLAMPKNDEENNFVYKIANDVDVWLGFNDAKTEGKWVREDKAPIAWSKWEAGEPNDYRRNEDGATLRQVNKMWNDVPTSRSYRFVCEGPRKAQSSLICADFLKDQCKMQLVQNKGMCHDYPYFASQFCAKTCGLCST